MIRREDSLEYHAAGRPGKIELRATKPCLTPREMRLAYLPGATFPSKEIASDPSAAFRYTARGNLVGVVTNGTAVPGLAPSAPWPPSRCRRGSRSSSSASPTSTSSTWSSTRPTPTASWRRSCVSSRPSAGSTSRTSAPPRGSTSTTGCASEWASPSSTRTSTARRWWRPRPSSTPWSSVDKRIDAVRVVLCGAGTVGTGCARLLLSLGVRAENLLVYDVKGLVHPDREDLHEYQRAFAREDPGPAARRRACGARTSSSAPPPAASSPRRWSARWPASRSCSPSRRPSRRSTTRRPGRAGRT